MPRLPFRFLRKTAPWLLAAGFFLFCVSMTALREPALLQQAFVIALMVCAFGMLLFAFARPATALVVSGGLFLALNFLSVLKLRYFDSPLMPADFIYYARSSLLETLGHYPHLWTLSLGVCVLTPLVLWAVWHLDRRLLAHVKPGRAWTMRISGVLVWGFAFWVCLLPKGPFAEVH